MKRILKKLFLFFGFRVQRVRNNPTLFYSDPWLVQSSLMRDIKGELIIFDVGSFNGQIAEKYRKQFPKSTIYCFEPFSDSFELLKQRLEGYSDIELFNLGLHESERMSNFYVNQSHSTNSLLKASSLGKQVWGSKLLDQKKQVEVELNTLDNMVDKLKLDSIHILKIDVQGSEYSVLKGGERSLKKGVVKVIFLEIINIPIYDGQKEVYEIFQLLNECGFVMFGTYNNSYYKTGLLRQYDAIFVHNNQ